MSPPLRHWVACLSAGIAILTATLAVLNSSSASAHLIVLGKTWPAAQRVSIDRIDHGAWSALLKHYVDEEGLVEYGVWRRSTQDVDRLDGYLATLSRADLSQVATRESRLAFWINAYNALTVRKILREDSPSASELDGDAALRVGDRLYSLNQIENEVLRPLQEPRIHFAIVCGARGCPRLAQNAYTGESLEQQLQTNARAFFADPRKCEFVDGKLRLSPIFDWYADDFGRDASERLNTIAPYLPQDAKQSLRGLSPKIELLDYDGTRNERQADVEAPLPPPEPTGGVDRR